MIKRGFRGVVSVSIWIAALATTPSLALAQSGGVIEARGEASYTIPIVIPAGPAGH